MAGGEEWLDGSTFVVVGKDGARAPYSLADIDKINHARRSGAGEVQLTHRVKVVFTGAAKQMRQLDLDTGETLLVEEVL